MPVRKMPVKYYRLLVLILVLLLVAAGCGNHADSSPVQTPNSAQTAGPDATAPTPEPEPAQAVAVTAVNVGYGDAILVQLGGQSYLIDTGQKKAGLSLLRGLAALGVERLDGVFLTHTHGDHIGGFEAVAARYDIGAVYAAAISQNQGKVDKLAQKAGLTVKRLSAGDTVKTAGGAAFEMLGPIALNPDDDNDNSLVLRLEAGGLIWLFTGDMQFAEEKSLMDAGVDLKADVLKVGNHGNPDATSDAFGKAVSPMAAVISTSTAEDDDSANARVVAALNGADIYVTQDFTLGVKLAAEGGKLMVSDVVAEAADVSVAMAIDTAAQTVTLTADADIDLSGWMIWSEKGNELFVFPSGVALTTGQPLTVACRGGMGDLIWDEKKVWSSKNGEAGVLVTRGGAVAARLAL